MCKIVLNSSIHGVTSGYLVNYAKKSLFYSREFRRGLTPSLDDGARHFRRHAFVGGSGGDVVRGQLSNVVDSMLLRTRCGGSAGAQGWDCVARWRMCSVACWSLKIG